MRNQAVIFNDIPTDYPVKDRDLKLVTNTIDRDKTKLGNGQVLVQTLYVSIDPYLRGRMRPAEVKSYVPAFTLKKPFYNGGVGKVIKSANPSLKEGEIIYGMLNWEEYTVFDADAAKSFRVIENKEKLPLSYYVGVLGMPGMTAYLSFYHIAKPRKGEVIFISAASGAVGQIVGQLAKREGLYVVGSAGEDAKVNYLLKELGFDAAFNYKKEPPKEALKKYCPKGIDIYFENVGGETLEAAIDAANQNARIVVCGMISQYNTTSPYGVKNLFQIVGKRLTIQGFIVFDLIESYGLDAFFKEMPTWLAKGELKYKQDIAQGLENAQDAFIGLLHGKNFGKALIKVAAEVEDHPSDLNK